MLSAANELQSVFSWLQSAWTAVAMWAETPLGITMVGSLIGGFFAAVLAGLIVLCFSIRAQRRLARFSVVLQIQNQIFIRFGEVAMEAQFLLSRAQAIRRSAVRNEPQGLQAWPATGLALMDKEAAIRSFSGPIAAHFSADSAINRLYVGFLDNFIRLRRILINQREWDQGVFEQDQDSLNDLYSELHFRMGGVIEQGRPCSAAEVAEHHQGVAARREQDARTRRADP